MPSFQATPKGMTNTYIFMCVTAARRGIIIIAFHPPLTHSPCFRVRSVYMYTNSRVSSVWASCRRVLARTSPPLRSSGPHTALHVHATRLQASIPPYAVSHGARTHARPFRAKKGRRRADEDRREGRDHGHANRDAASV